METGNVPCRATAASAAPHHRVATWAPLLAALHGRKHFDPVAVGETRGRPLGRRHEFAVEGRRDHRAAVTQLLERGGELRCPDLTRGAVDENPHASPREKDLPRAPAPLPGARAPARAETHGEKG